MKEMTTEYCAITDKITSLYHSKTLTQKKDTLRFISLVLLLIATITKNNPNHMTPFAEVQQTVVMLSMTKHNDELRPKAITTIWPKVKLNGVHHIHLSVDSVKFLVPQFPVLQFLFVIFQSRSFVYLARTRG